ncbi:MAG: transporter substrate-binding domain-containing protein [Planctomycetota bacterium]|nr:MAG: transporter substrate-binding domain-containing protein [Planctomycetota bacterium]
MGPCSGSPEARFSAADSRTDSARMPFPGLPRALRVFAAVAASLALALAPLFGAGCGAEASPIRIGINPWPAWEFFYLAEVRGHYRDCGVEVEIVEFSSLGDAKRAYERGQVDAYLGTLVEVATTHASDGRAPVVALVTDYSNGADQVIARAPLATPRDLVRRRVAVEKGSLNVFVLARALDACGASLAEVELVDLDQLGMLEAFRQGTVDAIVAYPPVSLDALKLPGSASVFTSASIPGEIVDVLAVDGALVRDRADDVEAIRRAYARAVADYEREPASALTVMAKREGLAPAEFEAALRDGVRLVGADEQAEYLRADGKLAANYAAVVDVLRRTGQLDVCAEAAFAAPEDGP